jgi:hypothetical protein
LKDDIHLKKKNGNLIISTIIVLLMVFSSVFINNTVSAASQNLALNKPATAISTWLGNDPYRAVDGNLRSGWGPASASPAWLSVDLGQPTSFNHYIIDNTGYGDGTTYLDKSSDFQISDDGTNWTTVDSLTGNTSFYVDRTLSTTYTARYVRVYINQWNFFPAIGEFELFNITPATTPTIITSSATNIMITTATMGGNVTSDGDATITERGIVYSNSMNPTTSDSKVTANGTTGTFTVNLTGLTENTTYHYRAYATNSQGTSYGADETFTTSARSGNNDLSNIQINGNTLSNFSPSVTEYTYQVPNEITDVSVTGAVYDPTATVQVTGGQTLLVGSNPVILDATAQNGTIKRYVVDIVRAGSSNAQLSQLSTNVGGLSPLFNGNTYQYSMELANSVDGISVTASVYDPNATIQVDGSPLSSGQSSGLIPLQVGSNIIQVVVLAQDGMASQSYTLNVTRLGHSSESSSGSVGGTTIGGQLTVNSSKSGTSATEASSPSVLTKILGSNVSLTATVLTTDGKSTNIPDITIGSDGQFQVGRDVVPGQYPVIINVTAPTGEVLAGKSGTLTVNSNGTASMKTDLIDPYGVIEDSVTKQPISGANVQLYWADTDLNRSKGRTPGTVVKIPELPDFAPNQNHNPQVSATDGRYGWMVFPDGDYYVVAQKNGYETYDSRKDQRDEQQGDTSYIRNGLIHVGKTIVHLNFTMTKQSQEMTGSTQKGYVKGYADGTFRPENSITRAELAAMLSRVLPLSSMKETKNAYQDVPATHWAMQPIEEVTQNQVMSGYPDGSFHPDSPITRAEMASIVARVKHLDTKQTTMFKDTMNHWASASIGAVQTAGFMKGYPDGTFHPDQPLTRAETVTIVNLMMGITASQHTSQVTWKDVPSTYWAYDQIENASR